MKNGQIARVPKHGKMEENMLERNIIREKQTWEWDLGTEIEYCFKYGDQTMA